LLVDGLIGWTVEALVDVVVVGAFRFLVVAHAKFKFNKGRQFASF
jgi:hypothetical protein